MQIFNITFCGESAGGEAAWSAWTHCQASTGVGTCEEFVAQNPNTFDPVKIRAVTLGSNFTARIFCQVRFCRCKISGLELVFSVVDLDFRAVYQLIGIEPRRRNSVMLES